MNNNNVSCFSIGFFHPRYWLTWLGLLLFFFISFLPVSARHFFGKKLGSFVYRKNKKRRKIINTNVQLCFPELDTQQREQFAEAHMQWYGCGIFDYSFFFFASRKRIHKSMVIDGEEKISIVLSQSKPVILLLGHSVFLEFAPAMIGKKHKAYASYKPSSNPVIDWMISRSRGKHLQFTVAREAGMMKLIRELKGEQMLVFLPDEDHGRKHSDFAPFFTVDKATLNTPARIAKLAKAESFPMMAFYDETLGKYKIIIGDALCDYPNNDPEQSAAIMNAGFESLIRQYPTQYMWLMKLFKTQRHSTKNRY